MDSHWCDIVRERTCRWGAQDESNFAIRFLHEFIGANIQRRVFVFADLINISSSKKNARAHTRKKSFNFVCDERRHCHALTLRHSFLPNSCRALFTLNFIFLFPSNGVCRKIFYAVREMNFFRPHISKASFHYIPFASTTAFSRNSEQLAMHYESSYWVQDPFSYVASECEFRKVAADDRSIHVYIWNRWIWMKLARIDRSINYFYKLHIRIWSNRAVGEPRDEWCSLVRLSSNRLYQSSW